MSKKIQPDPKLRTVTHLNADKQAANEYAEIKRPETVDIQWHSTPANRIEINFISDKPKNAYPLFNDDKNSDNEE